MSPLRARDVMRTEVMTVRPDMSLSELEETLLRERIHGAPVVEANRAIGVVSRSDVVRQLKLEEQRVQDAAYYLEPFDVELREPGDHEALLALAGARVAKLSVRDVMTEGVVSVPPDATLQRVAQTMLERPVHRLFVMDHEELLGVVSSLDLLRLLAEGKLAA